MTRQSIVTVSLWCVLVGQQGSTQDALDVTMRVVEDPAEINGAVIIVIGNENDAGRSLAEGESGDGEPQPEPPASPAPQL